MARLHLHTEKSVQTHALSLLLWLMCCCLFLAAEALAGWICLDCLYCLDCLLWAIAGGSSAHRVQETRVRQRNWRPENQLWIAPSGLTVERNWARPKIQYIFASRSVGCLPKWDIPSCDGRRKRRWVGSKCLCFVPSTYVCYRNGKRKKNREETKEKRDERKQQKYTAARPF